jgi:predicted rRNA methylase YqxC with S4 and FtsJ domains
VPQLERLRLGERADLVSLVKPTFELRRATLASSEADLVVAIDRASRAMAVNGWNVIGGCDAPATGQRGAREAFIHATRSQAAPGAVQR